MLLGNGGWLAMAKSIAEKAHWLSEHLSSVLKMEASDESVIDVNASRALLCMRLILYYESIHQNNPVNCILENTCCLKQKHIIKASLSS